MCNSRYRLIDILALVYYNGAMPFKGTREEYNTYMREDHLKRYHRMRTEAIEQLGGKCAKCGSLEKLQLDHVNPKDKKFEVSVFLSVPLKEFKEELKKCQVLCYKCHVLKSTLEQGHLPVGTHGTLATYTHGKCRCQECRDIANKYSREYRREWRKKKRLDSTTGGARFL